VAPVAKKRKKKRRSEQCDDTKKKERINQRSSGVFQSIFSCVLRVIVLCVFHLFFKYQRVTSSKKRWVAIRGLVGPQTNETTLPNLQRILLN
jgi:hypothetical protein